MHQFFVEDTDVSEQAITITGSDVNHIKNVLRMKAGEKIRVSTKTGKNYYCSIQVLDDMAVTAEILEKDEAGTELPSRIYLFQGLPKSDKMELIIQKAVELGAAEIYPTAMKNCVVKLDEKKAAGKVKRWQQISESAAKQSKRSVIPVVHEPMKYQKALQLAESLDVVLVAYENERGMAAAKEAFEAIKPGMSVGIFIGPEGGFDPDEISLAREKNMNIISLGKRILRTETAGLAILSILMYQLEI